MKYTLPSLALASVASARALYPRDSSSCCFGINASGNGISGSLGQLSDGQNRVGPAQSGTASYCISNSTITDSAGRGCVITSPTDQFQCDQGASPTAGFSLSSSGTIEFHGNGTFYACPVDDNGNYNIYTKPVANMPKCVSVGLSSTNGSCAASSSSVASSVASPVASSVVSPVASSAASPVTSTVASVSISTANATCQASTVVSTLPAQTVTQYITQQNNVTVSGPTQYKTQVSQTTDTAYQTEVNTVPGPTSTVVRTEEQTITNYKTEEQTTTAYSTHYLTTTQQSPPQTITVTQSASPITQTVTVTQSASPVTKFVTQSASPITQEVTESATQYVTESASPVTQEVTKEVTESATQYVTESASPVTNTQYLSVTESASPVTNTQYVTESASPITTTAQASPVTTTESASAVTTTAQASTVIPTPQTSFVNQTVSASASASSSSCPSNLPDMGDYQAPRLIVPVNQNQPSTTYGTQYNAYIGNGNSTIFNFDIPQNFTGKQCTVIFTLPKQSQLETSFVEESGSGGVDFKQLKGPVTQSTSYDNAPSVMQDFGVKNVTTGNAYTITSGSCQVGQTLTYELSAVGDYQVEYFQDYNPCPIGLWITAS